MKNKLYTKIIKLLEQMDWKMTEAQNNLPNIAMICSLNGKDTNSKIFVNLKENETKMDAPAMTEILEELGLLDEVDKFDTDLMFVVKIIELLEGLDRKLGELYFLNEIEKGKEKYTLEDMILELKKFYYGSTHVEKHFNK
tara:strand:+ start:585 stop:1004 length:420 start_codon:yes stop_codon:yes gene_type:complete